MTTTSPRKPPASTHRPGVLRALVLLLLALSLASFSGCKDEEAASEIKVNERPPPEEGAEGEAGEAAAGAGEVEAEGDEGFEMGPEAEANPNAGRTTARAPEPKPSGTEPVPAEGEPQPKRVVVATNFLKVAQMLDRQDIREAVGYKGLLAQGDFAGQAPSKTYNATRLASEKGFGIALQVWKPGSAAAASRHFDTLYGQSLGGERTRDAGDSSFRTEHHDMRSLVFLDRRRSSVAWVSCESEICDFEQLAELARRVQKRL